MHAPRVALFATCVANAVRPRAARAALKLLRHAGCQVVVPEQSCCGQPAFNAGHEDEARRMARAFLQGFAAFDAVVAPSASCAGMLRNHLPGLFPAGSEERRQSEALATRTFELCDFLHRLDGPLPARAWSDGPVIWHDSCASLRETPMTQAALALLNRIEGLTLLLPDEEARQTCCGFGGLFSVKVDAVSAELARRKWEALLHTAGAATKPSCPGLTRASRRQQAREAVTPDCRVKPGNDEREAPDSASITLTGPDMGCLMHLKAWLDAHPEAAGGRQVRVRHVAEILAGEDSREHTP